MPLRLVLEFMGLPKLSLEGRSLTTDRRKAVALLAYLAVSDLSHPHQNYSRESLSALFWPDYQQSRAFSNLRRTIWEIHQAIGEGWLIAERESVRLNPQAEIDLDVARFQDLLRQSQHAETGGRIPLLVEAVQLYRNHFLTGFSLKDAPNFNEWAFAESESLRRQLANGLSMLSEAYCSLGQADLAIPYARRLITLDPLDESAHRQLMEVYLQAGQHSAALKQYQACEQILRKELNLDPQPETRALYKRIRKREVTVPPLEQKTEHIAHPNNLPSEFSSFIGREQQLEQITDLIKKHRLVTLVGTGGIGKTRLALQIGQTALNDHPNGVWLIALDSLSNPALVPQAVASVFEIRESADRPLLGKLVDFLQSKSSLLILDNCEHLLEACAQLVTVLLKNCPKIKILATSRETLNIAGEAIYYMPSLSIPGRDVSIQQLPEYESVRLFIERSALALSSFRLTNENAEAIVEICRKVDGIPLAIELAAARVNILKVDEIRKQLEDSFALLASDSRSVLPRQQTLQASLDWSWGLLSESEQIFLQELSVFAGGWTLESSQAVCEGDVLTLTNALVKKSLIVVNQESGRETRYRFHEIVRQYVHDKFVQAFNHQELHARHLKYFLRLAERAEMELRGHARVEFMERLSEERNNIRAALHWADRTDIEAGLYLSARLLRYWESFDLKEGMEWLEAFLHKPESMDFPLARAAALLTYGWLLTWLQQFPAARSVTEESLTLFRTTGNQRGEADALISLAYNAQFTYDWNLSVKLLHQALNLAQALDDRWRQAVALGYLGWDPRDLDRRFMYWEKAIQLYREVGDQISLANLLSLLAQFRVLNGDVEIGEKHLEDSMRLWHLNRRANVWEHPKTVKSIILMIRGAYEQAYAVLQEALVSAQESGNRMSYLWLRVRLGYAALHSGQLEEAHGLFVETAQNFYKDRYIIGTIFAVEGIASFFITLGKPEHAARLVGWADAMRKKTNDIRLNLEQADVDKIIATCLVKIGEAAFSDAYDDGQSMTFDEGVAYAIKEK